MDFSFVDISSDWGIVTTREGDLSGLYLPTVLNSQLGLYGLWGLSGWFIAEAVVSAVGHD